MKYLKKTTALLLSVLLLFSAMVTGATVLADGNTATITAAQVEAEAGANVDVAVTVNTTGLAAAEFTVDVDGLTVNSATVGESFTELAKDELTFVVVSAADADVTGEAVLVTLNVAVPADAAEGTVYDITVSDVVAADWAEADVAAEVVAGAVTVKAATPEKPVCEHDWDVVDAAPAEGEGSGATCTTTKPGHIDFVCSKCHEETTKSVQYWQRLVSNATYLDLGAQIQLSFSIRKDRVFDTQLGEGATTDAFLMADVATATGLEKTFVEKIDELEVTIPAGSTREVVLCNVGLAAKQLTDSIAAVPFVEVGGVWYSGRTVNTSVEQEALKGIADAVEIGATNVAELYANLLDYGSNCQIIFDYKADALARANLGEYASYIKSSAPALVNDVIENRPATEPIRINNWMISAAAKTEAYIYFRAKGTGYSFAKETIEINLAYGPEGDRVVTNLTGLDASVADGYTEADGRFFFAYDAVYPKCMRDTVSIEFIIDGVANTTATFSIAGIAAKQLEKETNNDVINTYYSMINFADAAKAVFG